MLKLLFQVFQMRQFKESFISTQDGGHFIGSFVIDNLKENFFFNIESLLKKKKKKKKNLLEGNLDYYLNNLCT